MISEKSCKENSAIRHLIIIVLFIVALFIRFWHIDSPPMDFSEVRQYQQAHIARWYYLENDDTVPEWKKEIARLNSERMGFFLEPRLIENIAVIGYRIVGGEHLWIPRAFSSLAWVVGAVFLYLIARRLFDPFPSLISVSYYLFLPFGISASRSFQPDPMMVMFILISIYMTMLYYEQATWSRILLAALFSSLAIFVKPYSLFIIFFAFLSISIYKKGLIKSFFSSHFVIFSAISLLPVTFYYLAGLVSDTGYLREHAQNSFVPHIIIHSYFWKDWFIIIGNVIGYVFFLMALTGLLVAQTGIPRVLLTAFWLSYLVFGIAATHHIHTHNYYHMLFIPIVALSIGAFAMYIKKCFRETSYAKVIAISFFIIIVGVLASSSMSERQWQNTDKHQLKTLRTFFGINPEFKQFVLNDFKKEVEIAQEIGELVGHSTNTVFLTADFGRSLAYHGELSGLPWPTSFSLKERSERGLMVPSKEELFNKKFLTIRTHDTYIKYQPDFFIITDFSEFKGQPDLEDFLASNFPLIAQTTNYLIYDLRKMSEVK